jgi:hypothetical protein
MKKGFLLMFFGVLFYTHGNSFIKMDACSDYAFRVSMRAYDATGDGFLAGALFGAAEQACWQNDGCPLDMNCI